MSQSDQTDVYCPAPAIWSTKSYVADMAIEPCIVGLVPAVGQAAHTIPGVAIDRAQRGMAEDRARCPC